MTYDPFDPFNEVPMYYDYYLKFDTEAQAEAVLFQGKDEDRRPKYAAVDVIGVIYRPTGKMLKTVEGDVPEMQPVPGWHVNVRHTAEAPELAPHQVFPKALTRTWL